VVDCLHTAKQVLDELGHICPLCRIAALEAEVAIASVNKDYQELLSGYVEGVAKARREGAREERLRVIKLLSTPIGTIPSAVTDKLMRLYQVTDDELNAAIGGEVKL